MVDLSSSLCKRLPEGNNFPNTLFLCSKGWFFNLTMWGSTGIHGNKINQWEWYMIDWIYTQINPTVMAQHLEYMTFLNHIWNIFFFKLKLST